MKVFGQAGRAGPVGCFTRFVPNKTKPGREPCVSFHAPAGDQEKERSRKISAAPPIVARRETLLGCPRSRDGPATNRRAGHRQGRPDNRLSG